MFPTHPERGTDLHISTYLDLYIYELSSSGNENTQNPWQGVEHKRHARFRSDRLKPSKEAGWQMTVW